jgi:hypothetical protein
MLKTRGSLRTARDQPEHMHGEGDGTGNDDVGDNDVVG